MRPHYPRSFFKLLSIGFAVVALPLVLVLIGHALSIQKLSEQGQRAVYQAAQITQASRGLAETLTSLERSARQYAVLGDAALREATRARHAEAGTFAAQLLALPLSTMQRQEIDEIVAQEQRIFDAVDVVASGSDAGAALAGFSALAERTQAMLEHNRLAVQQAAEALQGRASEAARLVYTQILVLVPVTLLLVAGFTFLITRPIRQIEQGIRGLGEGRLGEPIEVSGPEDLEQLGRRLDWLRLRLVELEAQKNRFLRHASHELKTPLAALREGSELLAEEVSGPLTADQREIVRILRDNSVRLSDQIVDLLRYAASDFERSELKLQACRPAEIISAVAADQALALTTRRLLLSIDADDFVMQADPERLRVIFDNLLSNAAKFSPEDGTITVLARVDGRNAVLEVADNGPGIAEEDRERVFEPFFQGRIQNIAGKVAGTGLGLSIVRDHALAHGGRIELLAGSDTRFRVTIPLK